MTIDSSGAGTTSALMSVSEYGFAAERAEARRAASDSRVFSFGSDVRLALAGIGLLIGVGMAGGIGVGWVSSRMLERAPEAEAQPVSLGQGVQEAWERLTQLAQIEWRPANVISPARAAPGTALAEAARVPKPADMPAMPPEEAARRFAEVKALSPHKSVLRAEAERTVDQMLRRFEQHGFDLNEVRTQGSAVEIPRIFESRLPVDIADVNVTEKRKRAFIKVMLPHILRENEKILADREKLEGLHNRVQLGLTLRAADQAFLADLAERYGVEDQNDTAELLNRVDIIPPGLALAQSIAESGWGTSRFALLGNAVYGQWTWNAGSGIVPENRAEGEKHEVLRFSGIDDSVSAYMRNLNSKSSYREFREKRAEMRQKDLGVDGYALAGQLHRYSVRGGDYIRAIRSIMRTNELEVFDSAKLSDDPAPLFGGLDFLSKL